MKPLSTEIAFRTPWFDLLAKTMQPGETPYYSLRLMDYAAVIAVTDDQRILMVRQYRPAVERYTIELPSGLVDPGETPEAAMRRELIEETGYQAVELEPIGCMTPDTGRLETRIWNFFAPGVQPLPTRQPEPGIELLTYSPAEIGRAIVDGQFDHALHIAPFLAAILRGKLTL